MPSFCNGMKQNEPIYAFEQADPSNQVTKILLKIKEMNDKLEALLSFKSLYTLYSQGESTPRIDWYCGWCKYPGADVIKNQGLLVYHGLLLFRACDAICTHLQGPVGEKHPVDVLLALLKDPHANLKNSIVRAYGHLDDYEKYCFACYYEEIKPELFACDCVFTQALIEKNHEFSAKVNNDLMSELKV